MAYDLLLRKQVPANFARGGKAKSPLLATEAIALATTVGSIVISVWNRRSEKSRKAEIARYKRDYADDRRITREVPVISLRETMAHPWKIEDDWV